MLETRVLDHRGPCWWFVRPCWTGPVRAVLCCRVLAVRAVLRTSLFVGVAEPSAKLEQTQFANVLFGFGANPLSGLCLVVRTKCTLGYAAVLA